MINLSNISFPQRTLSASIFGDEGRKSQHGTHISKFHKMRISRSILNRKGIGFFIRAGVDTW